MKTRISKSFLLLTSLLITQGCGTLIYRNRSALKNTLREMGNLHPYSPIHYSRDDSVPEAAIDEIYQAAKAYRFGMVFVKPVPAKGGRK
jgi:hypothetical protein